MLTNNKKSFVRSIAVLLVMLMVFAMGLTACGDAVTKEDVETTVADKLTAALTDYVKKDDEATVKAIVEKVLADGNISAEKLDELSAALEAYLTADDVKALIKSELASLALEDALNKDDVLEILKDYYTKDEIDAKFKDYFGSFKAADVQKILTDADKAMNGEDWDAATDIVIETIEYAQKLIKKLYGETYLQANMQAVNAILEKYALAAFDKVTETANNTTYTFYKNADRATFTKYVEYMILRQPTAEAMAELKATLDEAAAVLTFEDEQKALKTRLLALGEMVEFGSYENQIFKPAKDGQGNVKKTQVVTLHDKADFYTWNADFDAMLVAYVTDKNSLTTTTVDAVEYGLTVTYALKTATGSYYFNETGAKAATTDTLAMTSVGSQEYMKYVLGVEKVADLEDADKILLPKFPTTVFTARYEAMNSDVFGVETDWKTTGKYGYAGNELVYSSTKLDETVATKFAALKIDNDYNAIIAQLIECQTAANDANEMFDAFQQSVIYANTQALKTKYPTYTKYDDATKTPSTVGLNAGLVDALTISMCEPGGKDAYNIYLTDITDTYANVTKEMEQSCALNTDSIGIDEYDLYLEMMSKAYDLLWDKYRTLALEWADKLLMDYVSVTYTAEMENNANLNAKTATLTYPTIANDEKAWIQMLLKEGEWADDSVVTEGFINAFLNGAAIADETEEYNVYKLLDWSFENAGLNKFYENNGSAYYSVIENGAVVAKPYYANPLYVIKYSAEDIRDLLADSMRNVDNAINGAVLAEKKASGLPVQKAFLEYLKDGILNLEEIYDRFLIREYANMTYNNMAVLAAKITNFYGAQTNLLATVEGYLFGTASTKTFMGTTTKDSNGKVTAMNVADVTFTSSTIIDRETNNWKKFTFGLKTNQFVSNVASKLNLNPYAQSVDGTTPKIAGDAMKAINEYYAQATATIENVVIKANFLSYIDAARGNLDDLAATYWVKVRELDKDNTATISNLNDTKGDYELTIVNLKYYADRDEFALNDYKAEYVTLLSKIASKNNAHIALLAEDKTIEDILANGATIAAEVFADKILEVASYDHLKNCSTATAAGTAGWTFPYAVDAYEFIGEAAVAVDEVVNGNATCNCNNTCVCNH